MRDYLINFSRFVLCVLCERRASPNVFKTGKIYFLLILAQRHGDTGNTFNEIFDNHYGLPLT
jgi:hypothetical protein